MDEMSILNPVIVEATKFLFSEAGKWIDRLRGRFDHPPVAPQKGAHEQEPRLTPQRFADLEADPEALAQMIDRELAEVNAYQIKGLVEQIQIHRKNLIDHESTQAEYGTLTPQYINRAIEHETLAIVQKADRLKELLEQVYQRSIGDV